MKKYIRVVISIVLLSFLFTLVEWRQFFVSFYKVNQIFLLIAFTGLLLQNCISSLKWKVILNTENLNVPFLFLLKTYFIGNFISLFLPSSFGGDIYRVVSLKKYNILISKNASSVIFDRLSGLFALLSLAVMSHSIFNKCQINYQIIFIYAASVFLYSFLINNNTIGFIKNNTYFKLNTLVNVLESFCTYKKNKILLFIIICLSFLFQNNIVWIVKLYCFSLDVDISIFQLYLYVPLIFLTEALPISINGLGVREGAFVLFFTQAGYTTEQALSVAILLISMRYITTFLMGGSLFLIDSLCFKNQNMIAKKV